MNQRVNGWRGRSGAHFTHTGCQSPASQPASLPACQTGGETEAAAAAAGAAGRPAWLRPARLLQWKPSERSLWRPSSPGAAASSRPPDIHIERWLAQAASLPPCLPLVRECATSGSGVVVVVVVSILVLVVLRPQPITKTTADCNASGVKLETDLPAEVAAAPVFAGRAKPGLA